MAQIILTLKEEQLAKEWLVENPEATYLFDLLIPEDQAPDYVLKYLAFYKAVSEKDEKETEIMSSMGLLNDHDVEEEYKED